MVITRTGGNGRLSNPFPMGPTGTDSINFLKDVLLAYAEWLRLGDVPAHAIEPEGGRPPRILRPDGTVFPRDIAPRRGQSGMLGREAVAAVRDELNANQALGSRRAHTIRFICSSSCGRGGECHGDALAAVAKRLIGAHDKRVAAQEPIKVRKVRSDKGVKRGPRRVTGGSEYRIGILSLY